jgi:hypothetical protein
VLVFSGRITDLSGAYDDTWDTAAMEVTAADYQADLGNRFIGAEPWPAEPAVDRMVRILTAAAPPDGSPVSIDVASTLAPILMSWEDVDNRAADGMLTDVAQSVDGVLWTAAHPALGEYLRLEDPGARLALYEFTLSGGKIVIAPIDFAGVEDAPPAISACDVLRDPVTFTQDVSDIATRTEVSWLRQVAGPPVSTEEERVRVVDAIAELDLGTRSVSVQTLLTTQADATATAERLIARLGAAWRITGLAVTDADVSVPDAEAARMLLLLLNGITRGGQALVLTDLPAWSPVGAVAPIYLEGGTYTFSSGGWALDLTVSRATGIGQNAAWDELPDDPAWIWDAWEPNLTWDDLRGVLAP